MMKRILHATIAGSILLAAALVLSCKKDTVILYNDLSFVTASGGTYITDSNLEYIIVENASGKEIPAEGRLLLSSDILKKVRNGVFHVRVNAFAVPLTKDSVKPEEAPAADDPVQIEGGWFSGGYFNALLGFYRKDESETKHIVNLTYTLPTESNDTLYLRLRHDAVGEVPPSEDETDGYSYVRTYTCFHLAGLLPENTVAPVKVTWLWDTEHHSKLKLQF